MTPGHDLERDPGRGQRLGLLAAAAEDERVAALEADDDPARRARSTSSSSISLLGNARSPGSLPT